MDDQGHKKDIVQTNNSSKGGDISSRDQNPIDYFAQDQSFVYVYKKTEKLATALYMVTNLFGDSEPMKWSLRTKVSHLLSFIIGFKDVLESREREFSNEVKTKVLEVVSLLEVASKSGLVSTMNFSILKTEFINLTEGLKTLKRSSEERAQQALPKTFFDVRVDNQMSHVAIQQKHPKLNDQVSIIESKGHITSDASQMSLNDKVHETGVIKKTNRQSIIINLLKKKTDLTIKDITQVIRDCSEKTIQRELIALIDMGVLKKTGERRWSRYSLA